MLIIFLLHLKTFLLLFRLEGKGKFIKILKSLGYIHLFLYLENTDKHKEENKNYNYSINEWKPSHIMVFIL